MKKYLMLCVLGLFCFAGLAQAQSDVDMEGRVSITYDVVEDDAGNRTSNADDIQFDLKLIWDIASGVKACVKLDTEDTATDGDLIEEAYVTISEIGDTPLSVAAGRKELKYGQDMYLWDNYFGIHEYGEEDNVNVLEFCYEVNSDVKIYLSDWQSTEGVGGAVAGEPDDNFAFQSYAVKAEVKLNELTLNLSVLNTHDAGIDPDIDEQRLSVGGVFKTDSVTAFAELIQISDLGHTDGEEGQILGLGAKLKVHDKVSVGFMYEKQSDFTLAAANLTNTLVGASYDFSKKSSAFIEYALNELDSGVKTHTTTVGVCSKF